MRAALQAWRSGSELLQQRFWGIQSNWGLERRLAGAWLPLLPSSSGESSAAGLQSGPLNGFYSGVKAPAVQAASPSRDLGAGGKLPLLAEAAPGGASGSIAEPGLRRGALGGAARARLPALRWGVCVWDRGGLDRQG